MILGLEHRANGILGFQEKDGAYIAILKSPKNKLEKAEIYYDDPYNWGPLDNKNKEMKWICNYKADPIKIETDKLYEYRTYKLKSREQRFKYFFKIQIDGISYSYGEFGFCKFKQLDSFNYHGFAFTWNYSSSGKFVAPPNDEQELIDIKFSWSILF